MITTERQGAIAILKLDRPDSLNVLGEEGDGEAIRAACEALNAETKTLQEVY